MKTILSATSIVAVIGALSTVALTAESGYANATEIRTLGEQEIVIDPAQVEPAKQAAVPTADEKIIFVSQPVEAQVIVDPVDAKNENIAAQDETDSGEQIAEKPKKKAGSLDALVAQQPTTVASKELECLAGAVYFESKGEQLSGQLAVAEVIINRSKSGRFPGSYCGVVFQKSQFSFVRGGKMPHIDKGGKHWRNAVAIAHIAHDGSWASPVKGSLFFHATYVSPGWRLKRTGTVGNHVFYR